MADFKIYEDYLTLRSIHAPTKGIDIHVFRKFHATLQEARLDPIKVIFNVNRWLSFYAWSKSRTTRTY